MRFMIPSPKIEIMCDCSSALTTMSTSEPKAQPSRLPSLNQLAARININAPNGSSAAPPPASTAAPRPRLAAFTLRTTSNSSNTSLASTTDSVAVHVSGTRSTSPSALSSSPRSMTPSNEAVAGGDPNLTSEKLEKLNQETAAPVPEKKNVKVGYKNIPSLDAITARLQKTRALSVDGTAKPPEAEMIEDPKTPGFPMKAPEHPLEYPW